MDGLKLASPGFILKFASRLPADLPVLFVSPHTASKSFRVCGRTRFLTCPASHPAQPCSFRMSTLSKRGRASIRSPPEYLLRSFEAWKDEYHPTTNPDGFINLAVAENLLSLPSVAQAMSAAPPVPTSNLTYGTAAHFNGVVARFFEKYITLRPVAAEHIVVLNGATSVLDALTAVLCDEGDAVLTTGPGYRGLEQDVSGRAGAILTVAALDKAAGEGHPTMCVEALEDAWQREGGADSRVRMVIICSPNNPTGEVLSKELVLDIVRWGRGKGLHLVFDEVYAKSVYAEGARFWSVAEALDGDLGNDVHVVWTFSKDLCVSGMRIGALYTQNDELLASVNSFLSVFLGTSRHSQWVLEYILNDEAWLDKYFADNNRRLREAYLKCTTLFEQLSIPYMPAEAGFFIWVDLRKWMTGTSSEDEMELWGKLCDAKVLLTPASQSFGSHFGYFRVCFSAVDTDAFEIAWKRIALNVLTSDSKR